MQVQVNQRVGLGLIMVLGLLGSAAGIQAQEPVQIGRAHV